MDHFEAWHARRKFTAQEAGLLAVGLDPSMHSYKNNSAGILVDEIATAVSSAQRQAMIVWRDLSTAEEDRVPWGDEPKIEWPPYGSNNFLLPAADIEDSIKRMLSNPKANKPVVFDDTSCAPIYRQRLAEWFDAKGLRPKFDFMPLTPIVRAASPVATRWPWGEYETEHLKALAKAAGKFWVNYDPKDPTTAATNQTVTVWLKDQGISERVAEIMAQILRADGLPTGPRKERRG